MRNLRPIIMLGIAALLALLAVVALSSMMSPAENKTVKVVVVTQAMPFGQTLAAPSLKLIDWPAANVPEGTLRDLKSAEGRVLKQSLSANDLVRDTLLYPPGSAGGLATVIASGSRAMTVRVNDVVGVAGFALPGNYVDIIVNTEPRAPSGARAQTEMPFRSISKIVLEKILVLAIAQEASREGTAPKVVNAVTLQVTPEQAEKVDLARSIGTLSLVLRNQMDSQPLVTPGSTDKSLLKPQEASAPRAKTRKAAPTHCIRTLTGSQPGRACW